MRSDLHVDVPALSEDEVKERQRWLGNLSQRILNAPANDPRLVEWRTRYGAIRAELVEHHGGEGKAPVGVVDPLRATTFSEIWKDQHGSRPPLTVSLQVANEYLDRIARNAAAEQRASRPRMGR